jgi:tetratricopeptide (TPR) repeat protein
MKQISIGLAVAFLAGCSAPSNSNLDHAAQAGPSRLGDHSFKVTTSSSEAQRAFDRGLTWTYAFAHHAAETEFKRALEADPNMAMAYWGIALVNGPHINFPIVPPPRAAAAWEALMHAQRLAPGTSPLERALIGALGKRYANPQPEDRSALDKAYAIAMREVWRAYPNNADVGALYAEAEMDLHPWDLWVNGEPHPWTPPIVATLEQVLQLNPRHPGANHYYIHAMEASREPQKAVEAAERLMELVPDSSHLVHMPAHIFVRLGRWEDAAESNRRAMAADKLYRAAYPRPGFYALYMAHNTHFLAFTSMMRGRSEEAIQLAREMLTSVPPDFIEEYPEVLDGFTIFPSKVLMRFGKWEELLAEPAPPAGMPLARALWHFCRVAALSSLGRIAEAEAERNVLAAAVDAIPEGAAFGNNSSRDLAAVALLVADGEIAAQKEDLERSISKLREAARLEDQLRYDEPPDWIQPVRHTLGAVLLRAGKPAEAEKAYREDLEKFPENGWSLLGLRDALREQGKTAEAAKVDSRVTKAWAAADVRPTATCYCQEGKVGI